MHKLKYNQNHVKRLWIGIYIWKFVCVHVLRRFISHLIRLWIGKIALESIYRPFSNWKQANEVKQYSETIKFSHFHLLVFSVIACQLSHIVLWFTRFKCDSLSGSGAEYAMYNENRSVMFILLMFDVVLDYLCENESYSHIEIMGQLWLHWIHCKWRYQAAK